MKKTVLLFLMCCLGMVAHAQFYFGGNVGLSFVSTSVEGESSTSATYSIVPEMGYRLNKWFALGGSLGISYVDPGDGDGNFTMLDISPYFRTTFAHVGCVDFFADAVLTYEHAFYQDDEEGVNAMALGICPGIAVNLTDRWQLQGRTILFQHSRTFGDIDYKSTGFALGNNLNIGVIYKF